MEVRAWPSLHTVALAFFGCKLLLIYCYYSTDFEVHRNWLAITHSLPISKWYTENTSQWTLDYPPLFAWFEFSLSQIAQYFDIEMLRITNLSYFNLPTLYFQRLSVILVDLFYIVGSIHISKSLQRYMPPCIVNSAQCLAASMAFLLICNVGLLFVDSIHFQYNGFLSGIFLLSLGAILNDRYIVGALWFCILLNLKHIFLYIAPAYAVYVFRNYCLDLGLLQSNQNHLKKLTRSIKLWNCCKLVLVSVIIFGTSLGPFLYLNQGHQLLSRLFPFKRGLTHAFWAPNFWALYNFVDYCLAKAARLLKLPFHSDFASVPGYTTGLVQEFDHLILPSISPLRTTVVTIVSLLPWSLLALCRRNSKWTFLRLVVLCAFCSFLFGWHVHEKAVLLIIIPAAVLATIDHRDAKMFLILSTVGHYSLFPLLFRPFEWPIKVAATASYAILASVLLNRIHKFSAVDCEISFIRPVLSLPELCYLLGTIPLELYCSFVHGWLESIKYSSFLPLMLISIYCAAGVVYCFLLCCWSLVCSETSADVWLYKNYFWKRQQKVLSSAVISHDVENWQKTLRTEGSVPDRGDLRYIGGVDITALKDNQRFGCACLVILSWPDLNVVHKSSAMVELEYPYIPGFLAFREAPPLLRLLEKLRNQRPEIFPQVLMVDGNGLLHPFSFGLACHVGIVSNVPTIGVAKNLHHFDGLSGPYFKQATIGVGESIYLLNEHGKSIGAAVRATEDAINPVFVSVGNKISLECAVKLVIACSKSRIPEPIRQADMLSREKLSHNNRNETIFLAC